MYSGHRFDHGLKVVQMDFGFCFSIPLFSFYLSGHGSRPGERKSRRTIRNFTFEFQGGALRPNVTGTIVLRNLDKVKHGFTSSLEEIEVQVESVARPTVKE